MRTVLAICLVIGVSWPSSGEASDRVALVIGNSAYEHTSPLSNPGHDAEDVSTMLEKLGFDVITSRDVTADQFPDILVRFGHKLQGAKAAVFFYAGHGIQWQGNNFMVPVDAALENEFSIRRELFPMHEVVDQMVSVSPINIVFLDACRDNPLIEKLQRSLRTRKRALSVKRGLARMDRASGDTLIMYATAPGQTADDGFGRNSPFTDALLQHIGTPGIDVEVMLKRVTGEVRQATGNRQKPERLSRLTKEFRFNPTLESRSRPDASARRHELRADRDGEDVAAIERQHSLIESERRKQEQEAIRQRISAFVKWDHLQMGTTNQSVKPENFAERVHYYGRSNVSRDEVIDHKRRYYAKWPKLKYTLIEPTLRIWRTGQDNNYGVEFKYEFIVKNAAEERSGRGVAYLTLRVDDQHIRLVREDGRVLEINATARRR